MQDHKRMTRKQLPILMFIVMLAASCGKNKNKETLDLLPVAEQDTATHSMAGCDFSDSIQAWGDLLTFTIQRDPCDSLPVVVDQYGTKYKDNIFVLTIAREGKPFFKREFTKRDFLGMLSEDFRKHGVFDGFRYAGFKEGKMVFGTCVSYPESDMSQPFLIGISKDGSFGIEPDKTPINENPADSATDEDCA